MDASQRPAAERLRLAEDSRREKDWKRWGPYLSERQWGTVREDYSAQGDSWTYFPHEQARSRCYRWGEDGLLGISDRKSRLCFALALWNGRDPYLKERLFGLGNHEGNHGEDVKERYFYLDATPTHSYMRALYKYPQAEFPYQRLVDENRRRGRGEPEFELDDCGVFDDGRYFDVFVEYAKASPEDILVRVTACNRGPQPADLHILPTLWAPNTWSWGRAGEGYWPKPRLAQAGPGRVCVEHPGLGRWTWSAGPDPEGGGPARLLFTENETNFQRLYGRPNDGPFVKDAFHDRVVDSRVAAVNAQAVGTKAAAWYVLRLPAQGSAVLRLRLAPEGEHPARPFSPDFDEIIARRRREADEFYADLLPADLPPSQKEVQRQAYAGLLWSKQFYRYDVARWLDGDPAYPPPPEARKQGRNADWRHLYNRDVLSVPDKWEYPWYSSWDLAFQMIPFARLDPDFAKEQLLLLMREWYMHPNGEMPAYEYEFSNVNPPVHAWACWRVYKMTGERGRRDRLFLERAFQKLLINFTWWVNRKDLSGKHIFSGGFLGLDNIGVFDRSRPLPRGGHLEQADATAWMAFYCATMLGMAIELAYQEPAYEDVASKFFEHFIAIADAINELGGSGLWDEDDGFYYDQIRTEKGRAAIKLRSLVGIIPLLAAENLDEDMIARLPGFRQRMDWFMENRPELARFMTCMAAAGPGAAHRCLLAIPTRERLERALRPILDEREFLSPYGLRSLSKRYAERPYSCGAMDSRLAESSFEVRYEPGESQSGLFGGNSNWRGPVWFPVNYLLIEALERYHHFYGETLRVECPAGSGRMLDLGQVAGELSARLSRLFISDEAGRAPWQGAETRWSRDPHWRDLTLFHEFFHGETGRGLGASHQTGWTALVVRLGEDAVRSKAEAATAAVGP